MKIVKSIPKFGDVSWDTVTVQEQLYDLFSVNVTIDGIFGKETFDTLVAFQKAKGIETNQPGTIGPMTLKLLDLIVVGMNNSSGKLTITNDLRGKKDRHLHPSLRIFLEAELFPSGKILPCFKEKNIQQCAIAIFGALGRIKIFEGPRNNYGKEVGWVQGTTGKEAPGGNGDDWCLDHSQVAVAFMEDYFKTESPFPPSAHTITCYRDAKLIPGLTTDKFELGTICIAQRSSTSGHSMCVVSESSWDLMNTVEGNVNGTAGLFVRNKWINGDLKTLGFIRIFPHWDL